MFEKESEEYLKKDGTKAEQIFNMLNEISPLKITSKQVPFILAMLKQIFQDGAEFGYNKANEWHKVKNILPPMDEVVHLLHGNERFPVCAYRHIPYGKTEKDWVWECYWGSGYTVTQSVAKDYWWKEIVLPNGGR